MNHRENRSGVDQKVGLRRETVRRSLKRRLRSGEALSPEALRKVRAFYEAEVFSTKLWYWNAV